MTESEALYAGIPGGPELLAWFGRVPSFHDAEIVRVVLNRRAPSTLSIHVWNLTDQVDPQGYFILDRHAVVTFELEDVLDVQTGSLQFAERHLRTSAQARDCTAGQNAVLFPRRLAGRLRNRVGPLLRAQRTCPVSPRLDQLCAGQAG
jgi:hypothetical protein